MADFAQFLLDIAEGRYLFTAAASQRVVCFVSKELQALLPDFMRRVVAFEGGAFRYSTLEQEATASKYDSYDQQGLFSEELVSSAVAPCWLQDYPQNAEAQFLTPTQRQTKFVELHALAAKNTAAIYFFALTQREYDANPQALESLGVCVVRVPEVLDFELFSACTYFFQLPSTCSAEDLYDVRSGLSLDDSLILIEHGACVSKRGMGQFAGYSENLLSPNVQIRDLSEFFWSKDAKKFFMAWSRILGDYPEQFWISYWSTQFFLAYFFLERTALNPKTSPVGQEHALAPWFTWKAGWKKYTKQQVVALHNRLYEVDCELKNGSAVNALDVFFSAHFLNK